MCVHILSFSTGWEKWLILVLSNECSGSDNKSYMRLLCLLVSPGSSQSFTHVVGQLAEGYEIAQKKKTKKTQE